MGGGGGEELVSPRARFTPASLLSVSFVPRVFSGTKRTVACVQTPPSPQKNRRERLSPRFFLRGGGWGDVCTQPLEGQKPWERAYS